MQELCPNCPSYFPLHVWFLDVVEGPTPIPNEDAVIPTTLPTHPAAITAHAGLSLCQPPVRSSRWLLRKNSLRHFEHIRNESLQSLEMDTTSNYQTFQNPELWSVGPSHELHQSRKESGCGLRLGLCGVQRESTLGSKIILGFQTCAY